MKFGFYKILVFLFFKKNLKFTTDFAIDYIWDQFFGRKFCDCKIVRKSKSLLTNLRLKNQSQNLRQIFRSQIKILRSKNRFQKSQQTTNLIMFNGCAKSIAKSIAKFCDRFFRLKLICNLPLYDWKIGRKQSIF